MPEKFTVPAHQDPSRLDELDGAPRLRPGDCTGCGLNRATEPSGECHACTLERLQEAAPFLLAALLAGMREMSITGWHRLDCPALDSMHRPCSPLCQQARDAIAKTKPA